MHAKVLVRGLLIALSFPMLEAHSSRFGLDYVFPTDPQYQNKPFAQRYKDAGLKWVNFADVRWKYFEPRPPRGGRHRYQWQKLDSAVKHWQQHGFDITMTVRTGNAWFSGPIRYSTDNAVPVIELMIAQSDRLPKPEHMDDYDAFITALVERYDNDGKQDMPGLRRPIRYYQIGNEYGNPAFWTGTIEDYFKLLRRASRSARAAYSDVQIIPNGLRTNDAFHNDPNGEHFEEVMEHYESQVSDPFYIDCWRRMMELDEGTLKKKGLFEVVDAGGNGSWHTTSEGYYNYVRDILESAGNDHISIWDMEARNEPLLTPLKDTHTHMELGIPNGQQLVNILKNPGHRKHHSTMDWYRAEQSRITAKVFVTKFAAGNEKVFMGMPMDWDKGIGALSWPNPFMGFLDTDAKPWPAYFTLKYLIRELDGYTRARKLNAPAGACLYKFEFNSKSPVWVAWLEDENPRGPDAPLPSTTVTLSDVQASSAFEVPLQGNNKERIELQDAAAGVQLPLSPTPVVLK